MQCQCDKYDEKFTETNNLEPQKQTAHEGIKWDKCDVEFATTKEK